MRQGCEREGSVLDEGGDSSPVVLCPGMILVETHLQNVTRSDITIYITGGLG